MIWSSIICEKPKPTTKKYSHTGTGTPSQPTDSRKNFWTLGQSGDRTTNNASQSHFHKSPVPYWNIRPYQKRNGKNISRNLSAPITSTEGHNDSYRHHTWNGRLDSGQTERNQSNILVAAAEHLEDLYQDKNYRTKIKKDLTIVS